VGGLVVSVVKVISNLDYAPGFLGTVVSACNVTVCDGKMLHSLMQSLSFPEDMDGFRCFVALKML
jgi:hypothetical protein